MCLQLRLLQPANQHHDQSHYRQILWFTPASILVQLSKIINRSCHSSDLKSDSHHERVAPSSTSSPQLHTPIMNDSSTQPSTGPSTQCSQSSCASLTGTPCCLTASFAGGHCDYDKGQAASHRRPAVVRDAKHKSCVDHTFPSPAGTCMCCVWPRLSAGQKQAECCSLPYAAPSWHLLLQMSCMGQEHSLRFMERMDTQQPVTRRQAGMMLQHTQLAVLLYLTAHLRERCWSPSKCI